MPTNQTALEKVNPSRFVEGWKGTLEERFWRKVDKGDGLGCWLWTGAIRGNGYGVISVKGRSMTAHRVSLILSGVTPDSDKHICHHCDVRNCVRPSHLFEGTRSENMQDSANKGRYYMQRHPEKNWSSKLTIEQVSQIKRCLLDGVKTRKLAADYGVDMTIIYKIKSHSTWKKVLPASPTKGVRR